MAFCNKLGGLLRQNISSNGNVPVTSMLGSLRLMSTKLFIGGKILLFLSQIEELLHFSVA